MNQVVLRLEYLCEYRIFKHLTAYANVDLMGMPSAHSTSLPNPFNLDYEHQIQNVLPDSRTFCFHSGVPAALWTDREDDQRL
jgi:hypothetical protein